MHGVTLPREVGKVTVVIHFKRMRKGLGLDESLSSRYPVLSYGAKAKPNMDKSTEGGFEF